MEIAVQYSIVTVLLNNTDGYDYLCTVSEIATDFSDQWGEGGQNLSCA